MILDLSSILNVPGEELSVHGTTKIEPLEFGGNYYHLPSPIEIEGNVKNMGTSLILDLSISGSLQTNCDRCTKEIIVPFSFQINETLVSEKNKKEDDDSIVVGNMLDISDILQANILSNLSMKYLCKEDCKGLCPKCGKDLNIEACNCGQKEIDPRLLKLKKLLE